MTNLKIAAFVENRSITVNNKFEVRDGLIHAFCLLDDTSEMIADAMGIRHIDELNRQYHLHDGTRIRFFDNPNGILEFGHTNGVRDRDVDVYVAKTKDYIKTFMNIEFESILT